MLFINKVIKYATCLRNDKIKNNKYKKIFVRKKQTPKQIENFKNELLKFDVEFHNKNLCNFQAYKKAPI